MSHPLLFLCERLHIVGMLPSKNNCYSLAFSYSEVTLFKFPRNLKETAKPIFYLFLSLITMQQKTCPLKKPLWTILAGLLILLIGGGIRAYSTGKLDLLVSKCSFMQTENTVQTGDQIVVDYVGKHLDGKVFDTSIQSVAQEAGLYNPQRNYEEGLAFTVGAGQMIKGFDEAVVGMKVGETKTVEIPADKAYGERSEDMVVHVPLEEAGDLSGAEVGMKILLGGMYPATITAITDTEIVFDVNHELAGQTLVFDITIKSIQTKE